MSTQLSPKSALFVLSGLKSRLWIGRLLYRCWQPLSHSDRHSLLFSLAAPHAVWVVHARPNGLLSPGRDPARIRELGDFAIRLNFFLLSASCGSVLSSLHPVLEFQNDFFNRSCIRCLLPPNLPWRPQGYCIHESWGWW